VVLYCPDQLGPAYSRVMPEGLVELAYPTLDAPDRVDWVNYADRNTAASPEQVAADVLEQACGNNIFVVWRDGYSTFGTQCETVRDMLSTAGEPYTLVSADWGRYYEPASLLWIRR
jgi:mannosyltransferase